MTHLEAVNTLASERYLLGEMSEVERQTFEEHYFDCSECAEGVRIEAVMTDAVRDGLLDAPRVASFPQAAPVRRSWRWSVALPWAAAATLAVITGYQSFALKRAVLTGPVALAPVTVRPASRGQDSVVVMPRDGSGVTLAIDLGGVTPGGELQYELLQAGGNAVAAGRVPAPQAGVPLLLLIPANLLTPSARYTLVMRDSSNASLTVGDYRFTVEAR
jgi:anti-sigma factor RsiW